MRFHYCLRPNIWSKKQRKEVSLKEFLAMLPDMKKLECSAYSVVIVEEILSRMTAEIKKQFHNFNLVSVDNLRDEKLTKWESILVVSRLEKASIFIVAAFLPVIYQAYLKMKGEKMQFIIMIRGP